MSKTEEVEKQEHGNTEIKEMDESERKDNNISDASWNIGSPSANAQGLSRHRLEVDRDAFKMKVLSLLMQMTNTRVRGDLISGQFGPNVNPDILPKIDELRWTLLPRWQPVEQQAGNHRYRDAANHLQKLLERSTDIFEPVHPSKSGTSISYSEWMSFLELLSNNGYWTRVHSRERCAHEYDDTIAQASFENNGKSALKVESRQLSKVNDQVISSKDKISSRNEIRSKTSIKPPEKLSKTRKVKVEEIVISSSDISSSSDERSDSSSQECSSSSGDSRSRRRTRRHQYSRRRRDDSRTVVTPPIYEMDGKTTLKDYLASFDIYFKNKFKGNDYDKSQMLGKFLTGELLKVFEARGGRKLKYPKMKEELLTYYRKLKVGSKSYWKKQLESMAPNAEEPLDIFGMRLAEVAELAYPKDKKDCARNLRNQFLKRLPSAIVEKVLTAERIQKATSRGKTKYLPFSVIAEMAKDIQTTEPKTTKVMFTSKPLENSETDLDTSPISTRSRVVRPTHSKGRIQFSKEVVERAGYRSPSPNRLPNNVCSYCRKPGHWRRNCWREAKLCLICGQNHIITDCPKYNPSRQRSSSRHGETPSLN